MQKWEYLVESDDESVDDDCQQEHLDDRGEDGWELVSVVAVAGVITRYMKRPIE